MTEKKVNYLSNKELMHEFLLSKEQDQPTDNLARAFLLLVDRYARRPNFISYSWLDEMKGEALVTLCRGWGSFNPEKSNNPFAYFTQIVHNAFLQYIGKEKKQSEIKSAIAVDGGAGPMGWQIDWDEDADVSETYDRSHEYETTEQIVVEEDSDMFGQNLEDDSE